MPDTKIKRQRRPTKSFSKSPLSLYFLAPSCLSGYKSIMQNKPNSQNAEIATTPVTPKIYPNIPLPPTRKNKAKTNPIPPHRESTENRVSSIKYPALFMQNKPNSPKAKTNATSYTTRIYANIPPLAIRKNKPKQTQSCRGAASGEVEDPPVAGRIKPNLVPLLPPPRYASRFTRYDILHPSLAHCPRIRYNPALEES